MYVMSLLPESIQPEPNAITLTLRDLDTFASNTLASEAEIIKINLAKKALGVPAISIPVDQSLSSAFEKLNKKRHISLGGDTRVPDLNQASPTPEFSKHFHALLEKNLETLLRNKKNKALSLGEHLVAFDAAIYDLAKTLLPNKTQEMAAALNLIFKLVRYGIIKYYMDHPTSPDKRPISDIPVRIPENIYDFIRDDRWSLSTLRLELQKLTLELKGEESTKCEKFISTIDEVLSTGQFITKPAFNQFVSEIESFLKKNKTQN